MSDANLGGSGKLPCPHCPDGHRRPGSKPFAVWVGPERDHDGQPTTLHVSYTGGQHVSEHEAEYVREALRAFSAMTTPPSAQDNADARRLAAEHGWP